MTLREKVPVTKGYRRKKKRRTIAVATITASMSPPKTNLSIILSASRFIAHVGQPRELGSIMLPQSRQGISFIRSTSMLVPRALLKTKTYAIINRSRFIVA
jgi:hypothetical protein